MGGGEIVDVELCGGIQLGRCRSVSVALPAYAQRKSTRTRVKCSGGQREAEALTLFKVSELSLERRTCGVGGSKVYRPDVLLPAILDQLFIC